MAKLDWSKTVWYPKGSEVAIKKEKSAESLLGLTKPKSKPVRNTVDNHELFAVTKTDVTTIYFDGGCAPNPGKMSAGIVVCRPGMPRQAFKNPDLGYGTNNLAEWAAFIWAVSWAKDNGIKECLFIGDSLLVVNQAQKVWRIKDSNIAVLFEEFKQVSKGMELNVKHVLRDRNLAGIYLEHGRV